MDIEKLRPNMAITYCKRTPLLFGEVKVFFFSPMDLLSPVLGDFSDESNLDERLVTSLIISTTSCNTIYKNLIDDISNTFYLDSSTNMYYLLKGASSGFEALRQACFSPFNKRDKDNISLIVSYEALPVHCSDKNSSGKHSFNQALRQYLGSFKTEDQIQGQEFLETIEQLALKKNISRKEQDSLALKSIKNYVEAEDSGVFIDQVVPITGQVDINDFIEKNLHNKRQTSAETIRHNKPVFSRFGLITNQNSPAGVSGASLFDLRPIVDDQVFGNDDFTSVKAIYRNKFSPDSVGSVSARMISEILNDFSLSFNQIDSILIYETSAAHLLIIIDELERNIDKKISNKINPHGGSIGSGTSPALVCHQMIGNAISALRRVKGKNVLIIAETFEFQNYSILLEKNR